MFRIRVTVSVGKYARGGRHDAGKDPQEYSAFSPRKPCVPCSEENAGFFFVSTQHNCSACSYWTAGWLLRVSAFQSSAGSAMHAGDVERFNLGEERRGRRVDVNAATPIPSDARSAGSEPGTRVPSSCHMVVPSRPMCFLSENVTVAVAS